MPGGYAQRMTVQIAVKLLDSTVEDLDRLVTSGAFASRSDAVRAGLALVLASDRARSIDRGFAEGFARMPDTPAELDTATRLAQAAIEDEPWEPWW